MDYNTEFNYFDDETLAKDWFNELCNGAAWDIFQKQEEIVYMMGELGKGRKPMFKDKAYENIRRIIENRLAFMIDDITCGLIKQLYESDIDMPQDMADDMNEWYGYQPDDDNYFEGTDKDNGYSSCDF